MKQFMLSLVLCCLTLPAFAQEKSQSTDFKPLRTPPVAAPAHEHHPGHHAHAEKSCACAHKGHPAPTEQAPPAFTPSSDFAPAKVCDQAQKQHCQAGHCEKSCKETECKSCCGDKKAPDHAYHH